MRRSASSSQLQSATACHSVGCQPAWLPAPEPVRVAAQHPRSTRGVSPAELRLALSQAGAEELSALKESREASQSAQQPLISPHDRAQRAHKVLRLGQQKQGRLSSTSSPSTPTGLALPITDRGFKRSMSQSAHFYPSQTPVATAGNLTSALSLPASHALHRPHSGSISTSSFDTSMSADNLAARRGACVSEPLSRCSLDGSGASIGSRSSFDGGRHSGSASYPGCGSMDEARASDSDRSDGTASMGVRNSRDVGSSSRKGSFDGARTSQQQHHHQQQRSSFDSYRSTQSSMSRRDNALLDADCCGDSGCVLYTARSIPTPSSSVSAAQPDTLRRSRSLNPSATAFQQGTGQQQEPSSPLRQSIGVFRWPEAGSGHSRNKGSSDGGGGRKWACLSEGQAAVQLFWRLNHARQTVDFVRRQRGAFSRLDKAVMTIPQALETLDTLREYEAVLLADSDAATAASPAAVLSGGISGSTEAAPSGGMGLMEHALQTAEACRLAHPEADWFSLVGLLHGLGKLLAHPSFGSEAQWAVCGESFPVGCAHSSLITASEYFSVNPDRRRKLYNTPCGMYHSHCGLSNVLMSWGGPEYLHMVLTANSCRSLPAPAMWLLRHHKFRSLASGEYRQLLDDFDMQMLPWLREFQALSGYTRKELPGRLDGPALQAHYTALLAKYLPAGPLRW